MPSLHLYVVHTGHMVHRQPRLHGTIQTIREVAAQKGYTFRSILVVNPDPSTLQSKVQQLSDRVKYDKTGYTDIDAASSVLNLEEISNYEKHREVWRRIQKEVVAPGTTHTNDVAVVIEDDAIFIPEFIKNFEAFLDNPRIANWDAYLLSVATSAGADGRLVPVADAMQIIPSKCAYALRPTGAVLQILLDETETIRFSMRVQLSYIFQKRRSDLRAVISSRQCIMEGSKVGIYPSTMHPTNILIFNQEYMELFRMLQSSTHTEVTAITASSLYNRVKHIQSPDLLHVYGVVMFKCGKIKEAAEHLLTAIEWTQQQHGFLSPQSELLNNLINMHEHMQWDLPQYLSTPSKYDHTLSQSVA